MTIQTRCPNPQCAKSFEVSHELVGRKARCKNCGTSFVIRADQGEFVTANALSAANASAPDATEFAGSASTPGSSPPASVVQPEHSEWAVGDILLDLYEITGLLGEGGMGKVYKIHHRGWNLDMAVKSPRAVLLQEKNAIENFERECETWVNLGLHPHAVSCYYIRRIDGIPRVFAEYVDGGDLASWIRKGSLYAGGHDVALRRMLDIAIQFAWGLGFAHEQGLIHQDVKPANVMLTTDGAVKVTDFGLAKARGQLRDVPVVGRGKQTLLVSAGGMTPAYCSPEQANQQALSRKTDIWSWAVSVLEMFTGEMSWPSGSVAHQGLKSYLEFGPEDETIPRMPAKVVEILKSCLQRAPDARPRDMHEVTQSLIDAYADCAGQRYPRTVAVQVEMRADLLNNRALSLWDLLRADEAVECWDKALLATPQHLHATYNRGLTHWRQGKLTDEELLQQLEEASKSHPESSDVDFLRARVHLERGAIEAAIPLLEKCAAASPAIPEIQTALEAARNSTGHRPVDTYVATLSNNPKISFSGDGTTCLIPWEQSLGRWNILDSRREELLGRTPEPIHAFAVCPNHPKALAASGARVYVLPLESKMDGIPLEGNMGNVRSLAWSPDGRNALAVCDKKANLTSSGSIVRYCIVENGRCLQTIQVPVIVNMVAFSVDGKLGIAAGMDGVLRIFDLSTGKCVRTWEGHSQPIQVLAFTADGKWLVSGGDDGAVRVWDFTAGRCVQMLAGHTGAINLIACDPQKGKLVTGSTDNTYRVWELASGRCEMTFHMNSAAAETLDSAGRLAARRLLDTLQHTTAARANKEAEAVENALGLTRKSVTCMNGQFAVSGGPRDPFRLWEMPGVRCLRTFREIPDLIRCVGLTDDARFALVHRYNNELSIWKFEKTQPAPLSVSRPARSEDALQHHRRFSQQMKDAEDALSRRDFLRCYQDVLNARQIPGFERDPQALGLATKLALFGRRKKLAGAWHQLTLVGHSSEVCFATFLPSCQTVVSASHDHKLRLWNVEDGQCTQLLEGPIGDLRAIATSPDGRIALSAGANRELLLWDLQSRNVRSLGDAAGDVTSVAISSDNAFALVVTKDKTAIARFTNKSLRLWCLKSGRFLRRYPFETWEAWSGNSKDVKALGISPDCRFALTGPNELEIWDLASGKSRKVGGTFEQPVWIASHGRLVAMAMGEDIALSEFPSGKSQACLKGHTQAVLSLAMSADNRFMVSGGDDKTLRLWETSTGKCLRTFEGHTDSILTVAFSFDGQYALSAGRDKTIRLWQLDWDLEIPEPCDWDELAAPYLEQLLTLKTPCTAAIPSDRQPTNEEMQAALTRRGRPVITERDFEQLLLTLRTAGCGWLRPEGVKKMLVAVASRWSGPRPFE